MDDKYLQPALEAQVIRAMIRAKYETRILKDILFEAFNLTQETKTKLTVEFEKRCMVASAIHLTQERVNQAIDDANT